MRRYTFSSTIIFLSVAFITTAGADTSNYPPYAPSHIGNAGITSVGSDSMGPLMEAWVQQYNKHQPNVTIQIASRGSASAAAALVDGTADLGPMARPMKEPERKSFLSKYGFEPTSIRTAVAVTAVYVSAENPISEISLEALDSIYSGNRLRGAASTPKSWSELGVSGSFGSKGIMPIGTLKDSPAQIYFRQQVMYQGEFRPEVSEASDARAVFELLKANPNSIAFGELAEVPPGVKVLPVGGEGHSIAPTQENIASEKYPLARFLSLYFVKEPQGAMDAETKDFLTFILSAEGQTVVEKNGLTALPLTILLQERSRL